MTKTFLLIFILLQSVSAQLDDRHFIPPIYYGLADGGGNTGNFDRHYLVLSTPSSEIVRFTVTDGADNLILTGDLSNSQPIVHLLGRLQNGAYLASSPSASGHVVGTAKLNQAITDGLIIHASAPIYANVRHQSGYQGASLTAKGSAALGQEFRVATMRNNDVVHDYRSVFFSAMATEDDTQIFIDDLTPGLVLTDTAASGSPLTTEPLSITLQQGESYVLGINLSNYADQGGTASINDLNGTRITSSKPIVVNSGTVLGCPDRNNIGSRDMGFDQIAPVTRAGKEYVFVQGAAANGSDLESPTIVAVEDGTDLFINGSLTPLNQTPLKAGDYYFISGHYTETGTLYLETSKPVLAWQTMAGANSAATPGLNFVPPLNSDIATSVNNIAEIDLIGEATINIVAQKNESVTINNLAPSAGPISIPGTPDWVLYTQSKLTGNPRIDSSGPIAVSLIMLKSPIGAGAYYSGYPDFKPLIVAENSAITKFPGVILNAVDPSGGILTHFEWFHADGTTTGITGPTFEPETPGNYYLTAKDDRNTRQVSPSAIYQIEEYPIADLEISQSRSAETIEAGEEVTITLTITNHGPDPASEVDIESILPENLQYVPGSISGGTSRSDLSPQEYGLRWQLADLPAQTGQNSATLTFTVRGMAIATINTAATVSSQLIDSISSNDQATASVNFLTREDGREPTDPCLCQSDYVEFNLRDLDLLTTFGVFESQYDAARDVWHLVKDVLHCQEVNVPLEEEKRGFNEEEFYLVEDSEVIVTVIYDGADYYNTVAFYDAANPGGSWKTIWQSFATGPTAPLIPGSSVSLGVLPAETELRFGLVMNGGRGGIEKIYQDAYLNPAGLDFMASRILQDMEDRPLIVAFEDQLFEGRDNDFNDVILKIDIIPTSLGLAQHDETIAGQSGLQSDDGSRGLSALLDRHQVAAPSFESTAELFDIPSGMTQLTLSLLDDRSPMKFTLGAFDYDLVHHLNPQSEEFRTIAARQAIPIMDNRDVQAGDEVTINPRALGLGGKTIGLILIPNNTIENYLRNPWRYSPTGQGENTKRQPLFSLINANPASQDQMFTFDHPAHTILSFEDTSNIEGLGDFDDIQLKLSPSLNPAGFHNGRYFEGSPDLTEGFTGPDGYGESHQ